MIPVVKDELPSPFYAMRFRPDLHTVCVQVDQAAAAALTPELVQKSQWFCVTPLPDGVWEVTVKREHRVLLTQFISRCRIQNSVLTLLV